MNSMIEEFRNNNKDIYDKVIQINNTENIEKDFYNSIRSISFDYAVMETTEKPVFTVAGEFGWNDIGSWLSYYELLEKDENGNYSKGDVHFVDCKNSMALNLSGKPVVIFNRDGELFVDAGDVTLSAKLSDHQAIRKVTEYLKENKSDLL
jgi:mannose-1-phosphate guanylyltransferase